MQFTTIQKQYVQQTINLKTRTDGRSLFDHRKLSVVFLQQRGSLQLELGETKVFARTKGDIVVPKPDRPSQGIISFRVDASIKGQQSKKLSTQITKLFERIIKGSNALDPQSLCISTGKYVWSIVTEIILINDDGNIIDCMQFALMLSLLDFRKPGLKIQKNKIEINHKQKQLVLSIHHLPISFTFGLMKEGVFLDPINKQQNSYNGRITIVMNIYKDICSIHKPGGISIEHKTLMQLIQVCQLKITQFTNLIRNIAQTRKQYQIYK